MDSPDRLKGRTSTISGSFTVATPLQGTPRSKTYTTSWNITLSALVASRNVIKSDWCCQRVRASIRLLGANSPENKPSFLAVFLRS